MKEEKNKRDWLLTLEKGLRVIRAFDNKNSNLTISQVAEFCGLDRATTRRALLTLVGLGYARDDGSTFSLSPKVMQLAAPFLTSHSFVRIVQPAILGLQRRAGIAASVSVLDGSDVVYVARAKSDQLLRFDLAVGSRLPAHLTAMGRVLLASLPDEELDALMASVEFKKHTTNSVGGLPALRAILEKVRERGYAVVDQELEGGLIAIAVPIRNDRGKTVAALGTSSHIGICQADKLAPKYLDDLVRVSAEISEGLLDYIHPDLSPASRRA